MTKYKIKVDWHPNVEIATIILKDDTGLDLISRSYRCLKKAEKDAKRVAEGLGIEYLGVKQQ